MTEEWNTAELIGRLRRRQPRLVRLAECVSLAAGVDWTFLRRARLRFVPDSTAGLEADLCFSPLVEAAGTRALLLDPEAAAILRDGLSRAAPQRLHEVRDFTAEAHAGAPRVVRLYEELLWSEVSPGQAADQDVARYAGDVLQSLAAGQADRAAADDVSRWTLHYVARLPKRTLLRDDIRRLQVASCERLGLEPPSDSVPTSAVAVNEARGAVQHDVSVGVVARSDGIVLSRPPAGGSRRIDARGTRHKVRVDATSSLAHPSEPVRLHLGEGRSLHLPFTVVQRVGPAGELRMSLAHPGVALDVAVSGYLGTAPDAAHCAVLLADGTIVLHAGDGSETRRVPPEGARSGARSRLALSADGTVVSYVQDGAEHHEPLRPGAWSRAEGVEGGGRDLRHVPNPTPGTADAHGGLGTASSRTADGGTVVRASADGRVRAVPSGPREGETAPVRDIGRAPWHVSSLAVSADGRRVAAVGNDSLLLEWPLVPGEVPRETRLRFCATRVFACDGGGWVVAGAGGPVELGTEDGRHYRVAPDTAPQPDEDGVPGWGRGCVLVEAAAEQIAAASQIPGVECLAVPVALRRDADGGEFESRLASARERGVRVVADLDVSGGEEGLLGAAYAWLDRGVDGLRLVGAETLDEEVLDDVRHLVEAYDERMLLYGAAAHGAAHGAVPGPAARSGPVPVPLATRLASSLLAVLGEGHDNGDGGDDDGARFRERMSVLKSWIERTFMRPSPPGSTYRWGFGLPAPLSPDAQRPAGAVLLSLPGCPVLPLAPLLRDGPDLLPLRAMLELRRNHLALSRGDCRLLDLPAPGVLGLLRRHGDESVLCLVNLAPRRATAEIGLAALGGPSRLLDLFDGSPLRPDRMAVTVPLPAGSVRWFGLLAQ